MSAPRHFLDICDHDTETLTAILNLYSEKRGNKQKAWGEARIKFLFWEVSAKFSWTDGDTAVSDEPSSVDAGKALGAALSAPEAWEVRPTLTAGEPVTLRDLAGWIRDHWGEGRWFPMWFCGMPFRNVYQPILHTTVAAASALSTPAGWPARDR